MAALKEIQRGIASDFECHLEDEQDDSGRCSGDNCVRCFVDRTADDALTKAEFLRKDRRQHSAIGKDEL